MEIGKGRSLGPGRVLDPVGTEDLDGQLVVADVVLGDQLIGDVEPSLVVDLVEQPSDELLVPLNRHEWGRSYRPPGTGPY